MNDRDELLLLLHGAGTGAWVWDRLRPLLPAPSLALDLPGRDRAVTPESCAAELARELEKSHNGPVTLVLHSLAGVLAAPLALRLGPRLRGIVFVAGVVPPAGGSFIDAMPLVNGIVLRVLFTLHRHGLKPSEAMIERELCNDLSAADTKTVVARYEAERPGLYLSRGPATELPGGCTYVKLLKDRAVQPQLQDRMIARLKEPRVRELATGHLPMLGAPRELADVMGWA